ncbi:MAG TPA: cobalamin-independent methionine synthase II family protein [Gammaproteobacteria bacterium]|nr:cobalamin-independent methionine synthase II family protein [Gammaproteobacteria bacterium]
MRISTERTLTTHVGSLPRSGGVTALLYKKDGGETYDQTAFDAAVAVGVADAVAKQVAAGVDIVSDGETSKVGYATYIKDRLSGFTGHHSRPPHLDLAPYPELREALGRMLGKQSFKRAACVGPVELVDRAAVKTDIANLNAALTAHDGAITEAFMNAASPGVISAFQSNRYYASHDEYVDAIAAAMKPEYDAIVAAGFVLQLDCPDLAMARHTGFQELGEEEFLARAEYQMEALNHAVRDIPAGRMRMHICWGNYEGPHDHDIPLERILAIVLKAKPAGILFEAANPRHRHEWTVWRDAKLPEDKILIPGCISSTSNYVEHPRLIAEQLCQYAEIVGRERVIAGSDCGFGSFAGYSRVDPAIAYKKLRALAEGAALATDRLWRSKH